MTGPGRERFGEGPGGLLSRPRSALRPVVLTLLLACLLPPAALAHTRSTSYSSWDIHDRRARVTVRMAALDVSRFPWVATAGADLDRILGQHAAEQLRLLAGRTVCPPSSTPVRLAAAPGDMVFEWTVECPGDEPLRIHDDLFFDVAPSHLHFARVRIGNAPPLERVLSDAQREWPITTGTATASQPPQASTVTGYVRVGIDHILSGPDHLAFVFALLLLGTSLGEVARIVTGFTAGHSITLALTVLGYLSPDHRAINALIGLSIALVAVENLWLAGGRGRSVPAVVGLVLAAQAAAAAFGMGHVPALTLAGLALFSACYFGLLARASNPAAMRWAIAFLFGLVHGFGFAGVLVEAQLSPDRLARALFGFNAGVEVGQLAIVLLVWPPVRRAAQLRNNPLHGWIVDLGSTCVLAIGLFWFVTRTYA